MVAVQLTHWGKIEVGNLTTFPDFEKGPVVVLQANGKMFVARRFHSDCWQHSFGAEKVRNGDIWLKVPEIPSWLKKQQVAADKEIRLPGI